MPNNNKLPLDLAIKLMQKIYGNQPGTGGVYNEKTRGYEPGLIEDSKGFKYQPPTEAPTPAKKAKVDPSRNNWHPVSPGLATFDDTQGNIHPHKALTSDKKRTKLQIELDKAHWRQLPVYNQPTGYRDNGFL